MQDFREEKKNGFSPFLLVIEIYRACAWLYNSERLVKFLGQLFQPVVVQRVRQIAGIVVIRVAVKGSVCDHEAGIPELPVVPVVREIYAGYDRKSVQRFNRE